MEGQKICAFKTCHRVYGPDKTINFYRFPKDFERAKQWATVCGLLPLYESKRAVGTSLYDSIYRICNRHFEDHFFAGQSKKRLKIGAVPTLDIDNNDSAVKFVEEPNISDSDPLEITAADGLSLFGDSTNNIEFIIDTDDDSEKCDEGTKENPVVIHVTELNKKEKLLLVSKDLSKLPVIGEKYNEVIDLDMPCSAENIKAEIKIEDDEIPLIEEHEVQLIEDSGQNTVTQDVADTNAISVKKPNTRCYVPHCTVDEDEELAILWFKAPTIKNLMKIWDICIGHPDKKLSATDVICSQHFSKDDIVYRINNTSGLVVTATLKEGAIPCLKFHEVCCVPNCHNKEGPMFTFPILQNSNFDLWLYMIKNPGLKKLTKKEIFRHRVCARHFEPDCFENDQTLKQTSAPTLFLPEYSFNPYLVKPVNRHAEFSVLTCAHGTCTNVTTTGKNIFKFPQDPDTCRVWLVACDRGNLISTPEETLKKMASLDVGVCEDHFLPHCFESRGVLKSDAVPEAFLDHSADCVRMSKAFSDDGGNDFTNKGKSSRIVHKKTEPAFHEPSAFTGVCTYRDCFNNKASEDNPFFSFPVDPVRGEEWLKACGLTMISPASRCQILKTQRICSKHFEKTMFESKNKLKPHALPIFYKEKSQEVVDVDKEENNSNPTRNGRRSGSGIIYCAVATCPNHCGVTYGRGKFPNPSEDLERYNIWILLVANAALKNVPPEEILNKYMVCLRHFEPFFYMKDGKVESLSDEAVPTRHLAEDIGWFFTSDYYKNRLQKYLQAIGCDYLQTITKYKKKDSLSSGNVNTTTCVLQEDGIKFTNMGYQLYVDKKPNSKRKLPYDVYKFCKMGYRLNDDVLMGENIKIHTAIIIDDDDECERQVLQALLNKRRRYSSL